MATSTFDRRLELTDPSSVRKLTEVMTAKAPKKELSEHPFSDAERDRSKALLEQFLSRSR